jgi:hypothetical protein
MVPKKPAKKRESISHFYNKKKFHHDSNKQILFVTS